MNKIRPGDLVNQNWFSEVYLSREDSKIEGTAYDMNTMGPPIVVAVLPSDGLANILIFAKTKGGKQVFVWVYFAAIDSMAIAC